MFTSQHLLANARAGMCHYCYRDAFETLADPQSDKPHMQRCMLVATNCRRCRSTSLLDDVVQRVAGRCATPDVVLVKICLPTDTIAAAASLVNKSGATAIHGTKAPNDWLQIANLMAQGKHEADYAFALRTVGMAAVIDEIQCSAPTVTCWAYCTGSVKPRRDFAWRRVRERRASVDVENGQAEEASEPSNATDTTPSELETLARQATTVDLQMGAHINGSVLHSTTVVCEHGDHVQDNRTASGEVGLRTARPRFPKTSECEEFLFSNDPENLVSAEALRNVGVGVADLSPDQARAFDEGVSALKKHMFTKQRVLKSERYVIKTQDVLPKNRTEQQKERMEVEALNANGDEAVPYTTIVSAFSKKEVTGKPRPRPIANHGDERVWGMAKGSAVFEDIMFHTVPYACIKHEEKSVKMNELFSQLDDHMYKIENDLSAFEFGIYDKLKQAECDIFKHIMGHLDLDSDNAGFCYRVIAARTKACTWVMNYIDAAGARCRMKIKMPRSMRESGDRITSSGNFLQNLLAWLTFLVKPGKVEAAVQSLIRNKGQHFHYTSARDGRVYKAFLAFEGDDTLGGLNEKILSAGGGQLIDDFFSSYGWKAKLKVASNQGDDCIQFVGYTALLRDGSVARNGNNVVMFPDIKRIIRDKPWTSSDIPDDEYNASVAIYATGMANEYRHFPPMYAFFNAMRTDYMAKGGRIKRTNAMLRDIYIKMHGDVGTEEQVLNNIPHIESLLDGNADYSSLARVHAGDFSEEDYSSMCGLTTLEMHGRDLACFMPPTWRV